MSKYGHRTHNWFESIVNKLGGEEAADRFLRDELSVSKPTRSWHEEDGVIHFSVTSDGTTGKDWITRLESKEFRVSKYAKQMLGSPDFKPTSGVTTKVAVLKGMSFEDKDRITKNIHAEADKRKLSKPNAELACLIREKFTNEEIKQMGLICIVVMRKPIHDSARNPVLLHVNCNGVGRWLSSYNGRPDRRWDHDCGFAFAVSQVSSQP